MSNLTTEQLQRLTQEINSRLDEFGQSVFDHLPPGVVRIAHDEAERLWQEEDTEVVEEYANARRQAYEKGFELGFQAGIHNPKTLGEFLCKLRNGRGLGIATAARAAGVAPRDVIAIEHDTADDPLLIGNLVRSYFADYPAVGDEEDDSDVDPGPDFDGGFYTQTPDGHTIHVNGDPNMDEATANAIREMADKVFEQLDERGKKATESDPQNHVEKYSPDDPEPEQLSPETVAELERIERMHAEGKVTGEEADQAWRDAYETGEPPELQPLPNTNGHHAQPEPVDDEPFPTSGALIHKPEPTAATTRSPIGPSRNPARAAVAEAIIGDAPNFDLTPKPSLGNSTGVTSEHKAAHKQAKLKQIINAMKGMAIEGQMPLMRQWDDARPAGLPNWQSISMQYDINSWGEMAEMCGLEYTGRRLSRPQVRAQKDKRARGGNNGNYLPTLEELIAEVQRQSMGGVMPSLAQFDQAKPANWATAGSHLSRFNTNWEQLAKESGLRFRGKNGNA